VFGWMGFNPGSTLGATDLRIGVVAVNTLLAACVGVIWAWGVTYLLFLIAKRFMQVRHRSDLTLKALWERAIALSGRPFVAQRSCEEHEDRLHCARSVPQPFAVAPRGSDQPSGTRRWSTP
jgi:Ammonium Transporter Family